MNQIAEVRSRGIQEADVFEAADALLAEGKRRTIERVRMKIGRGSPNTVSPMLERWFGTLPDRLVGSAAASGSKRPADNDPDGMPVGVRNAADSSGRRRAERPKRFSVSRRGRCARSFRNARTRWLRLRQRSRGARMPSRTRG